MLNFLISFIHIYNNLYKMIKFKSDIECIQRHLLKSVYPSETSNSGKKQLCIRVDRLRAVQQEQALFPRVLELELGASYSHEE